MDVFWAAFGGGAAAGIVTLVAVIVGEYIRWLVAQPKLIVSMSLGYVTAKGNTLQVIFQAQNPRTHPVTVSTFGYRVRNGKKPMMQVGHQSHLFRFPYEIVGGKSLVQWADANEVIRSLCENGNKPSDIKYAWFNTAAGKEFRGKPSKETIENLIKLQGRNDPATQRER